MRKFVFTCGDINGIGPEIVVKVINRVYSPENKIVFICPANVLDIILKDLPAKFQYRVSKKPDFNEDPGIVDIYDIGKSKYQPGKPTRDSGLTSYKAIRESFSLAVNSRVNAIITAPISKHALDLAGISYPGHTEMYAEWSGKKDFVMMFISSKMNCSLLTIHEPLKDVPKLLNKKLLRSKLSVVIESMKRDFGFINPKIALLGLNPHAGEKGRIGKEEISIFEPVILRLPYTDYIKGPFVPDAFFANKLYKDYDMVIGSYHDQVLIPFKMMNFSSGVNYTAGLPIIRTSPDHGTAYDIVGQNIADESSMFESFRVAGRILRNRMKWNHRK